jgi:hypothetical protein
VLQPNGRLFATFYFVDDTLQSAESSLRFEHSWGENARVADPAHPEAAIGFKLEWILHEAKAVGLEQEPPIRYGTWSGRRDGYSGQDVLILRKTA